MTLRYLLDTNALSEAVKPTPDAHVMQRLAAHHAEIATAAPVWNELLYGCYRLQESVRRRALERYLFGVLRPQLQALPYDERAAEWHASERARLERLGQTPPFVDGQIAAIAHANDLTLVTANVQDFAPFEGLRVEDWRQE